MHFVNMPEKDEASLIHVLDAIKTKNNLKFQINEIQ